MLNTNRNPPRSSRDFYETQDSDRLSLADLVRVLRRQLWLIIASTIVVCALALAYVLVTPKMYTSSAVLILDPNQRQVLRPDLDTPVVATDPAAIESEMETIRSQRVVGSVVDRLKLDEDPEFTGESLLLLSRIVASVRSLLSTQSEAGNQDRRLDAIRGLSSQLYVRRAGLSYAIAVSATSLSRDKAAQLANAVADAYIEDQIELSFNSMQRSIEWLRSRIAELDKQANEADLKARQYRLDNKLEDADGKLLLDQQLTEYTSQLAATRQQTEAAKARLDQIVKAIESGAREATVADALNNQIIIGLRQRYIEAVRLENELERKVGLNHSATVRARQAREDLEANLMVELNRLEASYRTDYNAAHAREVAAQAQVDNVVALLANSQGALVQLQELEGKAQTYRTLQENFRQIYLMSLEKQSAPVSRTSVVTRASAPNQASSPKSALILVGSLFVGAGLGAVMAFSRAYFDRSLRTATQLEAVSGTECLGIVPRNDLRRFGSSSARKLLRSAHFKPSDADRVFALPAENRHLWTVLRQPLSPAAEAMRNVKVSIDSLRMSAPMHVLGITSASAGEGKTTVAVNLATAIARTGASVLLIDGDLRKTQLTRLVMPRAQAGLVEVLEGKVPLSGAVWREAVSGAFFLPALRGRDLTNSAGLLSSPAMANFLSQVSDSGRFDYVLIDCPPALPVVDVRAFAHLIDRFLLVAAWGETSADAMERLSSLDYLRDRLLGAILTKVDLSVYKTFTEYDDSYYFDTAGQKT